MSAWRSRNGGMGDHRHLEPVIEITAEFPARDGAFEILVGGGDDADVDLFRRG